jgi:DNA-binding transcriptional LysR family regulator
LHDFSLDSYLQAQHIWVSKTGMGVGVGMNPGDVQHLGWVDEALTRMKRKRRISVFTRHYQAAMLLAEEKDLIVTIPARAARMQQNNPRLMIKQPPFSIPSIDLKMAWSPLLHHNPAHQWMRRLIVSIGRELS